MDVTEYDGVCAYKTSPKRTRQVVVRAVGPQADRPHQRFRLFHPAAPVPVDDDDAPAFDRQLPSQGQVREARVMVAPDRVDGGDRCQRIEGLLGVDIARVDDPIDSTQHLEEPIRQPGEELGAVGVGDHAYARGHLRWARIETTKLRSPLRLIFLRDT